MSTVKINTETLAKQVEEGMKKPELATFYGLSQVQMGKALKQAGLKIRKFHAPAFELVSEDTKEEVTDSPAVTEEELETSPGEEITDAPTEEADAAESTEKVTWTT